LRRIGAFAALSPMSGAEGTLVSQALSCTDSYLSTPVFTIEEQTDSAGGLDAGCTITSGPTLSCNLGHKSGHSVWSVNLRVRCTLNGTAFDRTATLSVTDQNLPPLLGTMPGLTIGAGDPISFNARDFYTASDTDRDGDALTYTCRYDTTVNGTVGGGGTLCTAVPLGTKTVCGGSPLPCSTVRASMALAARPGCSS
jgi:hypothetical protein